MPEGTTDKSGDSGVTSGVADEAMLAAVAASDAASSAASEPVTTPTGDTTPPASTGTAGTPSATTGQPGTEGQPKPAASGDAPEHRIQAAVRNARAKVLQDYGLTDDMAAADVAAGVRLLRQLRGDSRGFVQDMAKRLGLSIAEPAAEVPETFPDPDIVSKDGRLKTYTDSTLAKVLDIHGKRVTKQVMEQLAPYLQFVESESENREFLTQQEQRREALREAIAEVREMPHFNEDGVMKVLKEIPAEERRQLGQIKTLKKAYNTYVKTVVLPGLDAAAEKRIREANEKKVAASDGTIHPSSSSGSGKKPELKTVSDLARHMEALEAATTTA